jgi:hypothetical protein
MTVNNVKTIAALAVTASLLSAWSTASAAPYSLFGWFQRSAGGTLSSILFKAGAVQCPGPIQQPCYSAGNAWVSGTTIVADVTAAGPPAFDWNGITLTQTGLLWATSFVGSNPNSTAVISDKVTNLTITPGTGTTTAATYQCIEGTFLVLVGANGCMNVNLGTNAVLDSTAAYNIGGDASCVNRSLNSVALGDDVSTGNTRGLFNRVAGGGCDATDGGFIQYVIAKDTGGVLILSTPAPIGNCILFGIAPLNGCPIDVSLASATYFVFVAPGALDTDADGVPDAIDNCTLVSNANQLDTNGDGYGNICDADINNSGTVTTADFGLLRSVLGQAWTRVANGPPPISTISASDMNGSGTVTTADFGLLRARLGTVPGPSGLH